MSAALAFAIAVLFAQAAPPPPPPASETFELDIAERRIHRPDLHAGSSLRIEPGQGGIRIQIGAGLSARAIDVLLRNVHGTVRFRADTSRLDAALSTAPPPVRPATPESDQQ